MSGELERRASDTEREQAVARLRDASAEGRLTFEELADRTALAYRASTHAELEPLTADLPAAAPALAPSADRAGAGSSARSCLSAVPAGARSERGTS